MRAATLKRTLFTCTLMFCASAYGAEAPVTPPDASIEAAPEPPLIPEQVESGQTLEPEVTTPSAAPTRCRNIASAAASTW